MALASWDDFRSKWGFHEGTTLEHRDFEARAKVVRTLNENLAMLSANVRAVEYDRPGCHNPCMIVVLPATGPADKELLRQWLHQEISEQTLPGSLDLNELIAAAYED